MKLAPIIDDAYSACQQAFNLPEGCLAAVFAAAYLS